MALELSVLWTWEYKEHISDPGEKTELIKYLEQKLPEDGFFIDLLQWSEGKMNQVLRNTIGINGPIDVVQSKQEFIQSIKEADFLPHSVRQLTLYIRSLEDQFYTRPEGIDELKSQVHLHMRLARMFHRLENMIAEGSLEENIYHIIIRSDLEVKAATNISGEELKDLDTLLDLYDRLISLYQMYKDNKEFLAEKLLGELQQELHAFRESPQTIGTEELDRIEYSIVWGVKIYHLHDMFARYKHFMPGNEAYNLEHEIQMHANNPLGFGGNEYNTIRSKITTAKQKYEQIRDVVKDSTKIKSRWTDFTFNDNTEPYNTLFSAMTSLLMRESYNSGGNQNTFLKSNTEGLAISQERFVILLKQVSEYMGSSEFPYELEVSLSTGETVEVTRIISWEQERIDVAKRKDTKTILAFFSLLNNESFPTTQSSFTPDIRTISKILWVGDETLMSQVEQFWIMSSMEQLRDFSAVKQELRNMMTQGIISPAQVFSIVSAFVKPGTYQWLEIVSDLIQSWLINDSDWLKLLEWPKGFQEWGPSLNDYLVKNGFPQKLKDAISIVLWKKLSENELNNILIDTLYVHAIETRGGYNIPNDNWSNGRWYEQIFATMWKFDRYWVWLTSSLWTGLRAFPKQVLDMYPDLKELYKGLPKRTTNIAEQNRITREMKKRDARELWAEEQMIWRIVDSYARRKSAKPYVAKILKWDFSGTEYIYSTVHHTQGLTHQPTINAMNSAGKPILDKRREIIANLPGTANTMVASVIGNWQVQSANMFAKVEQSEVQPQQQPVQQVQVENNDSKEIQLASGLIPREISKWDNLGKVVYEMITSINKKTSFTWSGEVAVMAEKGIWNIPLQVWQQIEFASVSHPKEIAYYLRIGNKHYAIKADKTFISIA